MIIIRDRNVLWKVTSSGRPSTVSQSEVLHRRGLVLPEVVKRLLPFVGHLLADFLESGIVEYYGGVSI